MTGRKKGFEEYWNKLSDDHASKSCWPITGGNDASSFSRLLLIRSSYVDMLKIFGRVKPSARLDNSQFNFFAIGCLKLFAY